MIKVINTLARHRVLLLCILVTLVGVAVAIAIVRSNRHRDRELSHEPAIVSMYPAAGALVSPHSNVQVAFDRPISPEPLTFRLQAQLSDGSFEDVPAAVEIAKHHTSAIINPYEAMPPGKMRVSISAPGIQASEWAFEVQASTIDNEKSDASILLVLGEDANFGSFYGEILRAEGFTSFASIPASEVKAEKLANHQTLIVAGALDAASLAPIRVWVEAGGKLIAIRPTGALADFAGLARSTSRSSDGGDLIIDTQQQPGAGLVAEPIQFHGPSDVVSLKAGARALASLSVGSGKSPALTIKSVGRNGGAVAAFAFDLAQSVVLTRQGNPEWAGQDRDGKPPIRPNDLFYGAAKSDPRPDFVDLSRIHIPQADEQMRLLSNLILFLGRDAAPQPRFWYFPKGKKAVLIMAADDHGTDNGTLKSFERMLAADTPGCVIDQWECVRATSWTFLPTPMTNAQALAFHAQGFDIGSHATTYCQNWSEESLAKALAHDLEKFRIAFPDLPPQTGSRLHCIVWSSYSDQPKIGREWGLRFDMNYYYWPGDWMQAHSGFMTGSGLPMRFFDPQGELIDVYQQETHLVDEVFFAHPERVDALIARAVGPEGYYGAFGTHYDFHNAFDEQLIGVARKWDVPMVSAQQMLDWQDGRSNSKIHSIGWGGGRLKLSISADARTHDMLTTMLPLHSSAGELSVLMWNGQQMPFEVETLKGVSYAMFSGKSGAYEAVYSARR